MGKLVPFRGVLKLALFLSSKEALTTWHKLSWCPRGLQGTSGRAGSEEV